MGKLKLRRVVVLWAPPLVIAAVILTGLHTVVKADPAPSQSELQQYLQSHSLDVGIAPNNGYDQIYYTYKNKQIIFTTDGYNHLEPTISGAYISWQGKQNGFGQIYLYNLLNQSLLQLTNVNNNESPVVYNNTVVWQTWDGQAWQVNYYNGSTTQQITTAAASSVRPTTNGKDILYAQEVSNDDWKSLDYNIASQQTTTVNEGTEADAGYPQYADDGSVSTNYTAH